MRATPFVGMEWHLKVPSRVFFMEVPLFQEQSPMQQQA
jgi:hypothetical protein